ncbi:MAG: hypothetical protein AVDCRST_MAG18-3129, partial [uncultured Thermomicrobiales bacterium]
CRRLQSAASRRPHRSPPSGSKYASRPPPPRLTPAPHTNR